MPNTSFKKTAAVLLAGGSSRRMNGSVEDKILWKLNQKTVFSYSFEVFSTCDFIAEIIIVCRDEAQMTLLLNEISQNSKSVNFCFGGKERQNSVYNGLKQASRDCSYVYIHDLARPLIRIENILSMYSILEKETAVTLGHRVSDTIKRCDEKTDPTKIATNLTDLDRNTLWAMETPQAFPFPNILSAYERVEADNLSITDDNAAYEYLGGKVQIIENPFPNPKITKTEDLHYLEFLIK